MSVPADLARVEAVVHGRVQGVNFRAFAAREARDRWLLGWVRNVGPPLARVQRIEETWTPPEDRHGGFEVRR
jgi:acylphosphatase